MSERLALAVRRDARVRRVVQLATPDVAASVEALLAGMPGWQRDLAILGEDGAHERLATDLDVVAAAAERLGIPRTLRGRALLAARVAR
ncbi:MAG: hypothetical protein NZ761_06230 [Dehalococcoidia bacterium]|nr:hypothetical protein [Dehalococcoidia bacterium]